MMVERKVFFAGEEEREEERDGKRWAPERGRL